MAFSEITLTHTFVNANGTAASGNLRFILGGRMTNGTSSIMPATEVTSALNGSGALSVTLTANNDPATTPVGVNWHVIISIVGASTEEYDIVVPYNATGGTADLMSLVPQASQVM